MKFTHINRVIHQNREADDATRCDDREADDRGADDTTLRDDNLRLMTAVRMTQRVAMTAKPMTAVRMTLRDGD